MDYLDPNKQRRHNYILLVGYVFVAVAIGFATWILLYLSYGFAVNARGDVIQNGLVFVSSQPTSAHIALNGVTSSSNTNTHLVLPSGIYKLGLSRSGYNTWQRSITVDGGSVARFDYPVLFPQKLATTSRQQYNAAPAMTTQSADHRWLLVMPSATTPTFEAYDLKNIPKTAVDLVMPTAIVSKPASPGTWQPVEWADDNQHVVLKHQNDTKTEYILLDRANPDQSVNLNLTLGLNPVQLSLYQHKYDQYYVQDTAGNLEQLNLKSTTPVQTIAHVISYKGYRNQILYISDENTPSGKVELRLLSGTQTYNLRAFPTGTNYLIDLLNYDGVDYVVAGASSENRLYIYHDPVSQLKAQPTHAIVPTQVLHITAPNFVSFSPSGQYVVGENATQFGVYDLLNKVGHNYSLNKPLDSPQQHSVWMDGSHLSFVSGGSQLVFDYDGTNVQRLTAASAAFQPAFTPDYKRVLQLAPTTGASSLTLTVTALRTPNDL